jgi:hypothetical protein
MRELEAIGVLSTLGFIVCNKSTRGPVAWPGLSVMFSLVYLYLDNVVDPHSVYKVYVLRFKMLLNLSI